MPSPGRVLIIEDEPLVADMHDEGAARRTLAMGAFDYVKKPFEIDVLMRVLQAALVYRG